MGHWNDFFNPLLYINTDSYQPLQIILRNILLSNQAMAGVTGGGASGYAQQYADQIKFGVIIVSTLPVLCIYPFIQKYFEKGVMIGSREGITEKGGLRRTWKVFNRKEKTEILV